MPNEVEITITGDDKSKPAFVSALGSMFTLNAAAKVFNDNISKGLPLMDMTIGRWGLLRGQITLFGGALKAVPFFGAIGGLHLMADSILEVAATLIPATVAIAAFGVGAINTVQEITKHFQNMDMAVDMTGQAVYPLSGGFTRLQEAVKPEVYQLLGEGLIITAKNAGVLQTVAVGAGHVLDQLGARFTYAMTTGNGFDIFVRNSAKDLAGWGDLIGNLGGILGNVLKALPGYAEIILGLAEGFTHLAEVLTGSGIGQDILRIGLAAHGAVIYIGILATVATYLISKILPSIGLLGLKAALGLDAVGLGGTRAAGGLLSFGAAAEGAAGLPWGWITLAAAGMGFLVFELIHAADAAKNFGDAMQKAIDNAPLNMLELTIAGAIGEANVQLQEQVKHLDNVTTAAGKFKTVHGIFTQQVVDVSAAKNSVAGYSGVLDSLQKEQMLVAGRLNDLSTKYGGNKAALELLNAAGITAGQITDKNKQHWAEAQIQIDAQSKAMLALSGGTGRYAAALNALSGPQQYLGDILVNIQKITAAQDNLIQVVTSAQIAFNGFQQSIVGTTDKFKSPSGLADAFKLAKGNLTGLDEQSLAFSNTLYNMSIPALQRMIDALEQQMVGTKDLTTATATGAGEILKYTGKNTEARAVIVGLINNALGPGTVSLKTLNGWVKNNSTSLGGLNSIIAQSTIKAGTLANVLETQLNVQFHQALLDSSGASKAIKIYTGDLTNMHTEISKKRQDRAALIRDLENAGFSAHDATSYVNGLQTQINKMHGKKVGVEVDASGKGGVGVGIKGLPSGEVNPFAKFFTLAKGGLLPGFGGGDRHPALLESGEAVIDKHRTKEWSWMFKAMGVPGFAGGGLIGNRIDAMPGWGASNGGWFGGASLDMFLHGLANMLAGLSFGSSGGGGAGGGGAGGGSVAQNKALAKRLRPAWSSGEQWASWDYLWTRESGWNQFADNPTSDAYGIPQALPFTKMPKAAWPARAGGSSNPYAQENWGVGYIGGRYGSPYNAALHEVNYGWYDGGGWLRPGANIMMNGTGGWEHLSRDGSGGSDGMVLEVHGGGSAFERFMAEFIRNFVRIKGGGSVQRAFGRTDK